MRTTVKIEETPPVIFTIPLRKTIKFYRREQYGSEREFVHPDSAEDGQTIIALTGRRTIDGGTRRLIGMLSAGNVSFEEVIAP